MCQTSPGNGMATFEFTEGSKPSGRSCKGGPSVSCYRHRVTTDPERLRVANPAAAILGLFNSTILGHGSSNMKRIMRKKRETMNLYIIEKIEKHEDNR